MKKYIILLVAVLFSLAGSAQETVNIPLSNPSKAGNLRIGVIYGNITVIGYDGKEVVVTGTKREGRNKRSHTNSEKQGLKRITNNSLEFSVEEYNNEVRIKTVHNATTDFEIKVPKNFSLKLSAVNRGNILVENVNGGMEVSNVNGKITLNNVSGYVSADTVNKDIKVTFNEVTSGTSMAFSSLNGDLDVTFPKSIKADFKLKTDRGEIFTDFDLKANSKSNVTKKKTSNGDTYKVKVENWVTGAVNGGGAELMFKTFNGDIMIRAK